MISDDEDRITVSQVLEGHKDLFSLLIKKHERAVYGMGMSFFKNAEDALDFTQDVFLNAYKNLAQFAGRSRFSTWLYKTAYNRAINNFTRRKEYHSLAESDIVSDSYNPEKKLLRELAKDAVLEAIKGLPEKFKLCIDMFFFYDRSYKEIEVITGYPLNTIKSHVFRAKKLLKEKLKNFAEYGRGDIK